SEYRVEAECKYHQLCGGCSLQHVNGEYQIQHKQDAVLEQFTHIGQTRPNEILPPLTGVIWGYRNKARLGVKYVNKKGKVLVGFREKKKPSFIADIDDCLVLHPSIGKRISDLKELIAQLSIHSKIPQLEVAIGKDETALVVRHLKEFTGEDIELMAAFSVNSGIQFYLQSGDADSITDLNGKKPSKLHYTIPESDVSIWFSPLDFIQVNPKVNQLLVRKVLNYLVLENSDHVLDLFCGVGNFTLPIARKVAHVSGVEGSLSQVQRARENASINGLRNVDFMCEDLYSNGDKQGLNIQEYNKMLLDPPRSGAKEIISILDLDTIDKIVYVSCNPSTLARDAGILVNDKGYTFSKFGVIDMFPHTAHVESIAIFNK
ncbi:MAG: 23S rRNA (uracil(1939)-C(5))-methyltransferase RlmD, partial [Gammaproteobacteria bacterium]|nr:23S rRNA (uracil(1939)-C(5))-methyltransferase RlmD [Gammaproteobacteria bacterium]